MGRKHGVYNPDDPSKWTHLPEDEQNRLKAEADAGHKIKGVVVAILVDAHPKRLTAAEVHNELQRLGHQGYARVIVRKALFFSLNEDNLLTKRRKHASARLWWAAPKALREAQGIPHTLVRSSGAPSNQRPTEEG